MAVRKQAGFPSRLFSEADGFQNFLDAVALRGFDAGKKRAPHTAAAFQREPEIFKKRLWVNIDGRSLKFASDAETVDLVFVELGEVGVLAKLDDAGVGPRATVMMSSMVLLPAPFGPMMTRNSPSSM